MLVITRWYQLMSLSKSVFSVAPSGTVISMPPPGPWSRFSDAPRCWKPAVLRWGRCELQQTWNSFGSTVSPTEKKNRFEAWEKRSLSFRSIKYDEINWNHLFTPLRVGWPPTPQVYFGPWEGLRVVFPVGAPQAKNFHFPPRGGSPS